MSDEKVLGGLRFDEGKLRPELLPVEWIVELTRVMTSGSYKYDPGNWLLGMEYTKLDGCMSRHHLKYRSGQDLDQETKCLHLSLVAWNALALMSYHMRGIGDDPRDSCLYDENFMPLEGTYGHEIDLGMSPEEIKEMKEKYAKNKDQDKAKTVPQAVMTDVKFPPLQTDPSWPWITEK